MAFDTIDRRLADTGTIKIWKQAGKNIEISDLTLSSDAQATLNLSDGVKSFTIDIAPGTNHRCPGYIFDGLNDVTLTAGGGNVSIYAHVWKK